MSCRESAFAPPQRGGGASFLTNKGVWLGFVIAILVASLLYASLCFWLKRKHYQSCKSRRKQKGLGNLEAEKFTLRYFQLDEVKKATNNFSQGCLVGSGAYGDTYLGKFPGEGTFAVKKLHTNSYSRNEFRNEIRLLARGTRILFDFSDFVKKRVSR